jgi:putative membrane protein
MKLINIFISRLIIVAIATSVPVFATYGQNTGDATTGDDAHPTVDSPYLRKKPTPSASAAAAQTKLSQKDQKFLSQMAASGAAEVADGKVAQSQGDAAVKKIASRIVADRSASNKELLDLAKKKGIGLGVDKIKARNMSKTSFDKQYIHTVTHDYEEDTVLCQKAAQSSDDKDVKAWAAKTLPMLKAHLAMLKGAEH